MKIIVLFSDFPKKIFSKVYVVCVFSVKHLDVSRNNHTFAKIPTALQMAKVYKRLIINTMTHGEDYADAILRVYNHPLCEVLDNYNTSAYYEPSPYIARSYFAGGF